MTETPRYIKGMIPRLVTILLLSLFSVHAMSQTKRALVVGLSDYPQIKDNSWRLIHGANDAELIVPILKKQGFITTTICNKSATANKIRKAMNSLASSCKKGDVVYLHFSCHGQPFEDLNGDEEDGWDESIVPYDAQKVFHRGKYEGVNHIIDDELNSVFLKIRKAVGTNGFVYVTIDACHAGGASRGEDELDEDENELFVRGTKQGFSPHGKEFRPRINANGHFKIPRVPGYADIIILEACRNYQSNCEVKKSGKYYGPLSYYMSQILTKQQLTRSTDWVMEVRKLMNNDPKLIRQQMVYETSLE